MFAQKLFIAGLIMIGISILCMIPFCVKYVKALSNDDADGVSRAVRGFVIPGLLLTVGMVCIILGFMISVVF